MTIQRRVTTSRLGRLTQLGKLAGSIAGGVVSEGARQLAKGQRPSVGDLLITPGNARSLADQLSEMRGAAMKVGQLISMDSGNLLPPQFTEVLARLREQAHQMPLGQVAQALKTSWGEDWDRKFRRFNFTPLAAASIGQVHKAELRDGRVVAIKVQYPGIRHSIDSDVDNVATLLRFSSLLPDGLNLNPLLEEAKQQLHIEADYRLEAASLVRFTRNLGKDDRYETPALIEELTTPDVLAMGYLDGQSIERLSEAPPANRTVVATSLVELAFREVFDWGLVQTDPNFANYLYSAEKACVQLLDFGATREYGVESRSALRNMLDACIANDAVRLEQAAVEVGYIEDGDPVSYRHSVVQLLRTATEPVRAQGAYDFSDSDLAARMRDTLVQLRIRDKFGRLPPTEILFLHRKLGGLYLLLTRLRATVETSSIARSCLS